jgi:hypothetical protein
LSYASAKGKTARFAQEKRIPPLGLSEAQKEAIAGRVRQVKEHIPEALDFVRDLHGEGLVDGLRCIVAVTVCEGK